MRWNAFKAPAPPEARALAGAEVEARSGANLIVFPPKGHNARSLKHVEQLMGARKGLGVEMFALAEPAEMGRHLLGPAQCFAHHLDGLTLIQTLSLAGCSIDKSYHDFLPSSGPIFCRRFSPITDRRPCPRE